MIYLDASAMVSLVTTDRHSEAASSAVLNAGAQIAVSDFLSAEVFAVLSKRLRAGGLTTESFAVASSAFEQFVRFGATNYALTAEDGIVAVELVRRLDLKLRAPDALHLAICQRIGASLLSYDDNQGTAARAIGLGLIQ